MNPASEQGGDETEWTDRPDAQRRRAIVHTAGQLVRGKYGPDEDEKLALNGCLLWYIEESWWRVFVDGHLADVVDVSTCDTARGLLNHLTRVRTGGFAEIDTGPVDALDETDEIERRQVTEGVTGRGFQ